MQLNDLVTLGRSGLPVSRLTLGTMTMGNKDWGSSEDDSRAIFNAYVDAGGNSIDTADVYAGGRSEELVGTFVAERNVRDSVVLATKAGFSTEKNNALGGGASRKHLAAALEGSLRRLGTDYVDLYWLHVWDRVTPAEEVLATMGDFVRQGKIRYFGFSDTPAWFAVRAATLAQAHGVPGPVALQVEYSLIERSVEREHIPAARELGLGIVPWSPLAGGLLSGKYQRSGEGAKGDGRLAGNNPFGNSKFTESNWNVLDATREAAEKLGCSVSQVALAWLGQRAGVSTILLGTRTMKQLTDNLGALNIELDSATTKDLTDVLGFSPGFPYGIFSDEIARGAISGGLSVTGWSA